MRAWGRGGGALSEALQTRICSILTVKGLPLIFPLDIIKTAPGIYFKICL